MVRQQVGPEQEEAEQGNRDPEQSDGERIGIHPPAQIERSAPNVGSAGPLGQTRRLATNGAVVSPLERGDEGVERRVVGIVAEERWSLDRLRVGAARSGSAGGDRLW